MIASRVLLRSPLATVARRAVAVSSVRANAVRSYSSQAAPSSGGAGKSLVIAALAAGAGAAGYHFYAESQSKSFLFIAIGWKIATLSIVCP